MGYDLDEGLSEIDKKRNIQRVLVEKYTEILLEMRDWLGVMEEVNYENRKELEKLKDI